MIPLKNNVYYIGFSDRRLELFENLYPIPEGASFNSYIIADDKTAVLDGVDGNFALGFSEKVVSVLGGRELDYIIVNHMEPDHSGSLGLLQARYPSAAIVATKQAIAMAKSFGLKVENAIEVSDGSELDLGEHKLQFISAPMLHWPEVMFTLDKTDDVLYSADAFGSFGALSGNLYAPFPLGEARRYYTNIVGKYGAQVQAVLKKLVGTVPAEIRPLHGVLLKDNSVGAAIEKYDFWSRYEPEREGALVCYASVHGNTAAAAQFLASELARRTDDVIVCDVSKTHFSYLVALAFEYRHIVFASTTFNMGVFTPMENLLRILGEKGLKNRRVGIIENGSWAPAAGKLMAEHLKNHELCGEIITIKSAPSADNIEQIKKLSTTLITKP